MRDHGQLSSCFIFAQPSRDMPASHPSVGQSHAINYIIVIVIVIIKRIHSQRARVVADDEQLLYGVVCHCSGCMWESMTKRLQLEGEEIWHSLIIVSEVIECIIYSKDISQGHHPLNWIIIISVSCEYLTLHLHI